MPKIEDGMRENIAAFLPSALRDALQSYITFSKASEQSETREFKDHHDACKVAIAHIKLLIELAKWADIASPEILDEIKQQQLADILENAGAELGR